MLRTVVFDADLNLVVRHVQARDELSVLVEDAELRLRRRQARVDQHQPRDGLLRGLRPAVHQLEHAPQSRDAAGAGVSGDHRLDVDALDVCGVGEGIESLHRGDRRPDVATEVECRAGGRRHPHLAAVRRFRSAIPFPSCTTRFGGGLRLSWISSAGSDEVDPLGAQHRCRRQARDDAAALRPQPRRLRPLLRRHRRRRAARRRSDTAVRAVAAHGALGDGARRQRFGSDERPRQLDHGRTVRAGTDVSGLRLGSHPQGPGPIVNLTTQIRLERLDSQPSEQCVGPRR